MRSVVLAGSAVLIALGGSASAQDYYYEYTEPAPAPGIYYRAEPPAVVVRPSTCGEFRYWDGRRCVDARSAPPPLR